MQPIDLNTIVDIVFQLKWNSRFATHSEYYAARGVNLWRDWLPDGVRESVLGRRAWESVQIQFAPGELFGTNGELLKIDRKRFNTAPCIGRFYPRGKLSGLPGVFPQNIQPFRCVGIDNGHLHADMAHPLARRALSMTMTIGEVSAKTDERGGSSVDWVGLLTEGPGMQARWKGQPTDFFSDTPLSRQDPQPDDRFYANPRLVHHIDETARDMVKDIYRRFMRPDAQVLDLMSSWESHLPRSVTPLHVSGLGMNRTELEQNPVLSDLRVHDLNTDTRLPYPDLAFDVVICTVSVEYLTRPVAVFRDVARVLKPGGTYVVTFSNRWFPPKVVRIWEQLHEFERLGLVLEYFLRSDAFDRLGTYSMRGLPRPKNDKYAGDLPLSDPVYAVWGQKK